MDYGTYCYEPHLNYKVDLDFLHLTNKAFNWIALANLVVLLAVPFCCGICDLQRSVPDKTAPKFNVKTMIVFNSVTYKKI